MKITILILLILACFSTVNAQKNEPADPSHYLDNIKLELQKEWPGNRTINLVFHGHSVPAGYFKTPVVNTLSAYPNLLLKELKELYPNAVINVIVTAVGGENSISGEKRFATDVINHNPDVLFFDYCLNDRGPGLEKSRAAWESMIKTALEADIRVILLTPSPDQSLDILDENSILDQHANQVMELAGKYGTGLVNSYQLFRTQVKQGKKLKDYMSQVNHPNYKGHNLIAMEIIRFFR